MLQTLEQVLIECQVNVNNAQTINGETNFQRTSKKVFNNDLNMYIDNTKFGVDDDHHT